MIPRPDLLDAQSPPGIEVFQLTAEANTPSCHIYMEAQIFTPDSRRLILHRSAHAHGSRRDDPEHRFLLCDLNNHGALSPLTYETGATAPALSPDGHWLYYFIDETRPGGGQLTLRRVRLDKAERETLLTLDTPIPGTRRRPTKIYSLSTIRSDGKALAVSAFLGDGLEKDAPFGLLVFDLENGRVTLPLQGPQYGNMHPQYCRSTDSRALHDIMVQDNADNFIHSLTGEVLDYRKTLKLDIHVLRDDGTHFRNLPWGATQREHVQGHQCWRGRTEWAITSLSAYESKTLAKPGWRWTDAHHEQHMIESLPVPHTGHLGADSPGGIRNLLTRGHPAPRFYHFATDAEGNRLVTDYGDPYGLWGDGRTELIVAQLGEAGRDPLRRFTRLIDTRTSPRSPRQAHPFLSPDGRTAFFNSDESGQLQAYAITGL